MTKSFTRQELQSLLAPHPAPCISLFLPTHRRPPDAEQDPVRFKNLLGSAEGLLRKEYTSKDTDVLLAPLQALLHDDFWRQQLDGLAVFHSADLLAHYRIPFPLPERAVVADTFHLKPLVKFMQANRRFFVLALSQNSVALYEGTPDSLEMVNLPALPASLTEELGIEQRESFLNLHASRAGKAAPMYHGHGMPPTENEKDELARFFRAIDATLWEGALREEHAPLVLAGVGYYHPIYRALSRYQALATQGIEGNFERTTPEELHAKVWPVVSELFREQESAVLNEYGRLVGNGQAVDDLHTIAQAAIQSRVRRLLVAEGAHLWGRLNRDSGTIIQHPTQQDTHDDDVLDDLAECVLTRRGEVLLLEADRMPSPSPAAAILRW
jgi:hypothetical protein